MDGMIIPLTNCILSAFVAVPFTIFFAFLAFVNIRGTAQLLYIMVSFPMNVEPYTELLPGRACTVQSSLKICAILFGDTSPLPNSCFVSFDKNAELIHDCSVCPSNTKASCPGTSRGVTSGALSTSLCTSHNGFLPTSASYFFRIVLPCGEYFLLIHSDISIVPSPIKFESATPHVDAAAVMRLNHKSSRDTADFNPLTTLSRLVPWSSGSAVIPFLLLSHCTTNLSALLSAMRFLYRATFGITLSRASFL